MKAQVRNHPKLRWSGHQVWPPSSWVTTSPYFADPEEGILVAVELREEGIAQSTLQLKVTRRHGSDESNAVLEFHDKDVARKFGAFLSSKVGELVRGLGDLEVEL
jgi:hypothetical protein